MSCSSVAPTDASIRSLPPTVKRSRRLMSMSFPSKMRIVRLMARVAQHAAGVFGRDYLREAFGFGRVLLMAAAAKVGHVGELGLVGRRIVSRCMQRLRTVARLAGHMGVPARGARFALVLVA